MRRSSLGVFARSLALACIALLAACYATSDAPLVRHDGRSCGPYIGRHTIYGIAKDRPIFAGTLIFSQRSTGCHVSVRAGPNSDMPLFSMDRELDGFWAVADVGPSLAVVQVDFRHTGFAADEDGEFNEIYYLVSRRGTMLGLQGFTLEIPDCPEIVYCKYDALPPLIDQVKTTVRQGRSEPDFIAVKDAPSRHAP